MQLQSLVQQLWGISVAKSKEEDSTQSSETTDDTATLEGDAFLGSSSLASSLLTLNSTSSQDFYKSEIRFGSGLDAVVHVASAICENVFSFDLLSKASGLMNVDHERVTHLQVGEGAASVVSGALAMGSQVAVLLSSQVLPWFLARIFEFSATHQAIVFHVACGELDQDLTLSSSHEILYLLQSSGAILLNSSHVEELHDMALVAHLAARALRKPVVHFYDGVHVAQQQTKLSLLSDQALVAIAQEVAADATRSGPGSCSSVFDDSASGETTEIQQILTSVGPIIGRTYNLVEYFGSPEATNVAVVVGEASLALQEAVSYEQMLGARIGLLQFRILSSSLWTSAAFDSAMPSTVKRIAVLENISFNGLCNHQNVLTHMVQSHIHATSHGQERAPLVITGIYPNGFLFTETMGRSVYRHLGAVTTTCPFVVTDAHGFASDRKLCSTFKFDVVDATRLEQVNDCLDFTKILRVWSLARPDLSTSSDAAGLQQVLELLAGHPALQLRALVRESTVRDPDEQPSNHPVRSLDIHLSLHSDRSLRSHVLESAHLGLVVDPDLLHQYDVSQGIRTDGTLLVNAPFDLLGQLKVPDAAKTRLEKKRVRVVVVDAESIASQFVHEKQLIQKVLPVAFLKASGVYTHQTVKDLLKNLYDKELHASIESMVSAVWEQAVEVDLKCLGIITEPENSPLPSITHRDTSALERYGHKRRSGSNSDQRIVSENTKTAWRLFFPELFATKVHVRDQVTSLVQVTKWKRLTPTDYARNVFHMEMDITDTSIRYSIGEALAVFAHNDHQRVLRFLQTFELDPDELVTLPVQKRFHKHPEDASDTETLTFFQLFAQVLDVFGRPSKKFYEALARFATDEAQKEKLLTLLTPEGKDLYKQRVDEATTFADLLFEFDSARPPIHELIALIPRIKPRHYSIASSMKMHPRSVHLLVVLHDWTTPSGKCCIGQATRYLSSIQEGDWLSVAVCSSVMKLPVQPRDPVIMAGLGTGMAPFRAFLQERAFLKAQGHHIGPMALYFGSRHKSKEFLYGDELEQFVADGVLTHLRCAFSRDQAHKIYIQDRIKQDQTLLFDLLWNQNGHFYLCGPTWPVADVRDALTQSFVQRQPHATRAQASAAIELLREEGRYVLEVY